MSACENCKYYEQIGFDEASDQDYGHCRRYPPKLIGTATMAEFGNLEPDTSAFPMVGAYDWCGEYAPLDPSQSPA